MSAPKRTSIGSVVFAEHTRVNNVQTQISHIRTDRTVSSELLGFCFWHFINFFLCRALD